MTRALRRAAADEALHDLDEAGLLALLELRPDLASPPPATLSELSVRAGSWESIRSSAQGLDAFAFQLVEALCLLPAQTTRTALQDLLGGPGDAEALTAGLDRLVARALVHRVGDRLALVAPLRELSWPAGLGPTLAELTSRVSVAALEAMAHLVGASPGRTKVARTAALVAVLGDPARVRVLLQKAPAATVELAEALAAGPPQTDVYRLYDAGDRTPHGWLLRRGLLFARSWESAVMPREVAVALRGGRVFPELQTRRPDRVADAVDQARVDSAAAEQSLGTVRDVVTLLEECSAAPLALLKAGGVGVRDVRRLAKVLGRDQATTARLLELAAASGLLGISVDATAAPLQAYDGWRTLDPAERWARLAAGWLAWDAQLFEAGASDGNDKPLAPLRLRAATPHAVTRRGSVLAALSTCPAGSDLAGLASQLAWDAPLLWGERERALGFVRWIVGEAELLGVAAVGALSTAGRLALDRQLAPAVAALATHAPPVTDRFVLQADLTAMVAGAPAPAMRSELELLADPESTGAASVYRFSPASLRRGLDAGRSAADILDFLDRHASHGVPQPLSYLVGDLARRYGTVRTGSVGGYLRSDDPALLAEIATSRAAARLGLRALAPTVLVSPHGAETLLTTLRGAGYLNAAESGDGALEVTRPAARRAVPDRVIAGLARREAGTGTCFGPAEHALTAWLSGTRPPAAADLPALVGALRQAPGAARPALRTPRHQPRPAVLHHPPVQPAAPVSDRRELTDLLVQAFEQEWVVLVCRGNGAEQLLWPLDVRGDVLIAEDEDGAELRLAISALRWARAFGAAEQQERS